MAVAVSSVFVTGVLFSPEVRIPGPPKLQLECTSTNAFFASERTHADYRSAPGAIDVYVSWESDYVEEVCLDLVWLDTRTHVNRSHPGTNFFAAADIYIAIPGEHVGGEA